MATPKDGPADSQSTLFPLQVDGIEPQFSKESIKVIAESAGFDKPNEEAVSFLAENVTFKLKETIQEAVKFVRNSRRKCLTTSDIDNSLRVQNVEPLYGFSSSSFIPFRFASGGGREIFFNEDPDIDLEELINQTLPKIPVAVTLKTHWLAIEGVQPAIPENPPPIGKDKQLKETVEPPGKAKHVNEIDMQNVGQSAEQKSSSSMKEKSGKQDSKSAEKKKTEVDSKKTAVSDSEKQETQKFKPLVTHELSVEQQLYYKEITEACVGSNEQKRTEALHSLSSDPGLYQLLPRFTTFIAEGVKINVAQHNLALLIYLLRMIKALMENSTLYLEKYLHELIPAIATCIVSKQLCPRPEHDNHWALRDFAARLMAQLCRQFSSPTNNIQSRITKTLCKALYNEKAPLATHYGAIAGLAELGLEVVKVLVVPRLKYEGQAMKLALEGNNIAEKVSAEHLQTLLLKHVSLILLRTRPAPDIPDQYQNDFGYLGIPLCTRVQQLRQGLLTNVKTPSTPTTPSIGSPLFMRQTSTGGHSM